MVAIDALGHGGPDLPFLEDLARCLHTIDLAATAIADGVSVLDPAAMAGIGAACLAASASRHRPGYPTCAYCSNSPRGTSL